jgi:hypothetical protein
MRVKHGETEMTPKKTRPQTDKETAAYKASEAERAAIGRYLHRNEAKAPLRFKLEKKGDVVGIVNDHPNGQVGLVLTMDAFGTADKEFCAGMMDQLIKANVKGETVDEGQLNYMVSVINGVEPRDQLEAMLAAQMVTVHLTSMRMARELNTAATLAHQDSAERAFNKLTRTFTTQMEALKRYRTRGEQKITNVSVAEGGQAIVGDVMQAPREDVPEKAAASPTAVVSGTNVVPMPSMDESKERAAAGGRR